MEFKIEDEDNVKIELIENNEIVAKATCFYKGTPKINDKNIGTIGEFETKSKEFGIKILKKCDEILKQKNIELIVAPMNGNTWKQYRTLKYTNGEPSFVLENVNPIEHNDILIEAGFKELHTYTSTKGLVSDCYDSEVLDVLENKLVNENIKIRKFSKDNYLEDLKKIYNISIKSFSRNPFYTSIEESDFLEQYMKYIQLIDEELILIAEKDEEEIGFLFSIPDFNEMQRTGKISTLVLKTVAVLPEFEKYAIGNIMLRMISKKAKEKNYENWIFAFMYSNNTSQKMAKRNKTNVIREYALYGKEI